jgi:hypothetical protein
MKNMIKILMTLQLIACSSTPQITRWTSPDLRAAIDPSGIDSEQYVKLQAALIATNKFFIVDRGTGFKAVVKEQDHQWGTKYSNYHDDDTANTFERFGDKERYARLKKLYGVGSIIIASTKCGAVQGMWSYYGLCEQYLALINASTGEVITAVSGKSEDGAVNYYGSIVIPPSWDNTVEKFVKSIPREYVPEQYDNKMQFFREVVKEDAQRHREVKAGGL